MEHWNRFATSKHIHVAEVLQRNLSTKTRYLFAHSLNVRLMNLTERTLSLFSFTTLAP